MFFNLTPVVIFDIKMLTESEEISVKREKFGGYS